MITDYESSFLFQYIFFKKLVLNTKGIPLNIKE